MSAAPGHAAPSQRLINEATTIIYGRWRHIGLSHDEALEQAARFALRAGAIVARTQGADAGGSRS